MQHEKTRSGASKATATNQMHHQYTACCDVSNEFVLAFARDDDRRYVTNIGHQKAVVAPGADTPNTL